MIFCVWVFSSFDIFVQHERERKEKENFHRRITSAIFLYQYIILHLAQTRVRRYLFTSKMMHPIRDIKERLGSALENVGTTAPQIVKDVAVAVSDKVQEFNEKVLEPEQERFAEEHGYAHGGMVEKVVKYVAGIGKYEAGAHFLNEHLINPMREKHENDDLPERVDSSKTN